MTVLERDQDGRPSKLEITREQEFDVEERDSWQALAEYEAAICPQCNNLKIFCSTPEGPTGRGHFPQRDICYVSVVEEISKRRFAEQHKHTRPDESGAVFDDGVRIWASPWDLSPEDDFLEADPLAQLMADLYGGADPT